MNIKLILLLTFVIVPIAALSQHVKFIHKTKKNNTRFSQQKVFLIHTVFDSPNFYSKCKISSINGDSITIVYPTDETKRLTLAFSEIISFRVHHSMFKKIAITALVVGVPATAVILGNKIPEINGIMLYLQGLNTYLILRALKEFKVSDYTIQLVK